MIESEQCLCASVLTTTETDAERRGMGLTAFELGHFVWDLSVSKKQKIFKVIVRSSLGNDSGNML